MTDTSDVENETALEKVIRLSQVVVPRHERIDPRTGKVEDVDTYTYQRKGGKAPFYSGNFQYGKHYAPKPRHDYGKDIVTPTDVKKRAKFIRQDLWRYGGHNKYTPQPKAPNYEDDPKAVSDEDYARLSRVRKLLKGAYGLDSTSKFFRTTGRSDGHGTMYAAWTPGRAALHKQIIADVLAKADADGVPKDRQAVMTGGPPGSGKTTTLDSPESGIDKSKYLSLAPDDMKGELIKRGAYPLVPGLSPMETVSLIHEESFELANDLADVAEKKGYNVNWDLSMSSEGQIDKRLRQLQHNRYKTTGIFVSVPLDTSIARSLDRYKKGAIAYENGKGYGGRYIDPDIIRKSKSYDPFFLSQNEAAFDAEAKYFDDWKMFDNTGDHPVLIGSKELGLTPSRDPKLAKAPTGALKSWNGKTYRKTETGWEQYSSALEKVRTILKGLKK